MLEGVGNGGIGFSFWGRSRVVGYSGVGVDGEMFWVGGGGDVRVVVE